jgi:phosphoglycolate phosphatase-like HAD superfamily hydrolase
LHHIMFDVDGTLVDSYDLDSVCFIEAVKEVTGISVNSNWSTYRHITDSGILKEILGPRDTEEVHAIEKEVKCSFLKKLELSIADHPVQEISGASSFISSLKAKTDIVISIATGGWYESAMLKLMSAGLDISSIPLASSNDRVSRVEIMKHAELQATHGKNIPCTYFGDGRWDKEACKQLGYNFVLVGNKFSYTPSITSFYSSAEALACVGL